MSSPFHGVIPRTQAYPLGQIHLPIIIMGSTFSHAYTCDREHYELTTIVINFTELPKLKNSSTPAVPDYNKQTSSSAFHLTKETKVVEINPVDLTKTVRIGTKLLAK